MSKRRWYRCYACLEEHGQYFDFVAASGEPPHCPQCSATSPAVITLACTHYMARDENGPFGMPGSRRKFAIACNPAETNLAKLAVTGENASNELRAVNCPDCQNTDAFQAAVEKVKAELQARNEVWQHAHAIGKACCG